MPSQQNGTSHIEANQQEVIRYWNVLTLREAKLAVPLSPSQYREKDGAGYNITCGQCGEGYGGYYGDWEDLCQACLYGQDQEDDSDSYQ